jgi:SAM-dependent methyltransferase
METPKKRADHPGTMVWAQFPYSLFAEALNGAKHVLDVGCGTGGNCIDIALTGKQVIGVDSSKPALQIAELKRRNLHLGKDDFERLITKEALAFGEKNFIAFEFSEKKGFFHEGLGDVIDHDVYSGSLPLIKSAVADPLSNLHFLYADVTKPLLFPGIDSVVCVNTLHVVEDQVNRCLENMVGVLPLGGLLFLAYGAPYGEGPDSIVLHGGRLSCYQESVGGAGDRRVKKGDIIRLSDVLSGLGMYFQEDLTYRIQSDMTRMFWRFTYGAGRHSGCGLFIPEIQQSVYVGVKKYDVDSCIRDVLVW